MDFWKIDIADLVQIFFWLVIGVLTVLTYLQARRTVFQPLKTEVFKLQLVSLTGVSAELYGKGEWELIQELDLDVMLRIHAWYMIDAYAIDELNAHSPEFDEACRGPESVAVIGSVDFRPVWVVAESDDQAEKELFQEVTSQPMVLSGKHMDAMKKYETLASDPLLPSDISSSLNAFLEAVEENLTAIGRASERVAEHLEDTSTDLSRLNEVSWWLGVHSSWIQDRPALEEAAGAVLASIREYYQPDVIGFVAPARGKRQGR